MNSIQIGANKELKDIYSSIAKIDNEISELYHKRSLLMEQLALISIQECNQNIMVSESEVVPLNSASARIESVPEDDPFASLYEVTSNRVTIRELKTLVNDLVNKGFTYQVKAVFKKYGISAVKNTPEDKIDVIYQELENIK